MSDVETVWARIRANEGEKFYQLRGKIFTYSVVGEYIDLHTTNQKIPKKHIAQALGEVPLKDTVQVQHLRGPSYIYAILMDDRIRKNDW